MEEINPREFAIDTIAMYLFEDCASTAQSFYELMRKGTDVDEAVMLILDKMQFSCHSKKIYDYVLRYAKECESIQLDINKVALETLEIFKGVWGIEMFEQKTINKFVDTRYDIEYGFISWAEGAHRIYDCVHWYFKIKNVKFMDWVFHMIPLNRSFSEIFQDEDFILM